MKRGKMKYTTAEYLMGRPLLPHGFYLIYLSRYNGTTEQPLNKPLYGAWIEDHIHTIIELLVHDTHITKVVRVA